MSCCNKGGNGQNPCSQNNNNNAYSYVFIVLILYILLAIIIGGSFIY